MFIVESFLALIGPNVDPENQKIIINLVEFDDVTGDQLQARNMEIWINAIPEGASDLADDHQLREVRKQWRKADQNVDKLVKDLQKAMEKFLKDAVDVGDIKSKKNADPDKVPGWMKKLQSQ